MTGLPGTVLGIPGYLVSHSMPGGTTWDCPGYPGILRILGSMGLTPGGTTRACSGYPGILVSWDPWDSMPGGTTWDCPGCTRILSISGSMRLTPGGTTKACPGYPGILRLHAWWDYPGLSWVSRDTQYLRIHGTPHLVGLPGTVLDIPGYLISQNPWVSMPGRTTQDCPGYPGILSISGSMGLHAWWDYLGLSRVYRDT